MLQCVSFKFPNTTAGSDDDQDIPWPFKGEWMLESFAYSPETADAADATNYAILTIETMDVVANLVACTGTITNATTAFTVGTARTQALSGAACAIEFGDTIRVAKTEAGTGGIIFGVVTIVARKIP